MSESTHNTNILVYKLNLTGTSFKYKGDDGNEVSGCPPVVTGRKTEVKYGSDTLFLSLRGVSFLRKIYESGHIKAEILIQVEKDLSVSTLSAMFGGCGVSLDVGNDKVAKNYFVNEISPRFEKGAGTVRFIYVTLDIFSKDIILGFNKFSKAHLGRKLIGDIVPTYTSKAGVTMRPLSESKLQKLAYKDSDGSQVEFIHPYLVQYNESFLSFLRRVTNRCGEMFYFEDGQLCFGLNSQAKAYEIDNARRVSFQSISKGPFSTSEFPTKDFFLDSEKEKWRKTTTVNGNAVSYETYELEDGKVITDPVEPNNGFPKGSFPDDDFTYNSEIASVDHYMILFKNKFAHDNSTELWLGDMEARWVGWVSQVLNSTSLLEFIAKWGQKEIESGLALIAKAGKTTGKGNSLIEEQGIGSNPNYAVLFSQVDKDTDHWLTVSHYQTIREKEEAQARKTVRIDMGEGFKNVKLGDKITIPQDSGTTYVAVEINLDSSAQSQIIYAIPMDGNIFYPPVLPDKPFRSCGPQPAFVIDADDPSGQGRVRIRYPWQQSVATEIKAEKTAKEDFDNNPDDSTKKSQWLKAKKERITAEAATPWIRMASPSATPGGGIYFRPEKGDEVMVDFENGNIERPYVTGALYSKNVPAPLRGKRVIMSKNGHTIKMDDPSDATLILNSTVPGVKFLNSFGVNCPSLEGQATSALGGIELTDKPGLYSIKMSSHDRQIKISSPLGDIKVDALTGISIDAPNGDINITGKNINLTAYNKVSVTSGKNIKLGGGGSLLGYLTGTFNLKNFGQQVGKTAMDMTVMKFFDFSLIRTFLEIFVRPIDGTMAIKSHRYMQLEAGKGSTADDPNEYAMRPMDKHARSKADNANIVIELVNDVKTKMDAFVNEYVTAFNDVKTAADVFPAFAFGAAKQIQTPDAKDKFLKYFFEHAPNTKNEVRRAVRDFYSDNTKFKLKDSYPHNKRWDVQRALETLMDKIRILKNLGAQFESIMDDLGPNRKYEKFNMHAMAPDILKKEPAILGGAVGGTHELYTDSIKKINNFANHPDVTLFDNLLVAANFEEWKKFVKRRLIHAIIEKCRSNNNPVDGCLFPQAEYGFVKTVSDTMVVTATNNTPGDTANPFSDADWPKYIGAVKVVEDGGNDFVKGLKEGASLLIMKKIIPLEWWVWKPSSSGKILFSDQKGKTVRFKNGETESYENPNRLFGDVEGRIQTALNI